MTTNLEGRFSGTWRKTPSGDAQTISPRCANVAVGNNFLPTVRKTTRSREGGKKKRERENNQQRKKIHSSPSGTGEEEVGKRQSLLPIRVVLDV